MTIDIAIIDSGVNPWHSHVQGVAGGVSFHIDDSGEVTASDDFRDQLGHGTAIAGVIREKAPGGRLHAVRIFHQSLEAQMALLVAALDWAVEKQPKIIHLSLGTEREEYRPELERICRQAFEQDIVIVAAARTPGDRVYPSIFDTVIGVCWNRSCEDDSIVYHPGRSVEFGACGWPRALPGMVQGNNFRGSSFAAARVTGLAADLLAKNPTRGAGWVRETLKHMAEEENSHGDRE
jgi:subtilisin family serine protease